MTRITQMEEIKFSFVLFVSFVAKKLSRNFNSLENVGNDSIGRCAVEFGFGSQRKAMTQNGRRNVAHVVGRWEIAPANCGECL